MLGVNQSTSLSPSGNGGENFNFQPENPILENVVTQSNPDFLPLTSLDFLSQSQPIDIKQLTGGYVEVLGQYSLEDVQPATNLASQEIKKETLPLPDFQQVWMNQFSQRNSADQTGESLSGSSDQFSLNQLGENIPYHSPPPSYSASYGVNPNSPQYHHQGASPRQYFADNFPQTSPQLIKTEIPNSSPPQLQHQERSPEYISSSPGYHHQHQHQSPPQYVWPDQYVAPQHQHQTEYVSYEPQQASPGSVTVMVLNEDGTLDKRFTVPNDLLSEALISSPSPPLASPTSPLDLTAVSSSPFTMPVMTNSHSTTNMMSPVININNSTINMSAQNLDMSAKSNMYSFSNSNNNAGNLMAALSCLKRPLPRTVLGDNTNISDHAPQHIIQRALADFDQGQLSAFENFHHVLDDQKENLMNFSQERMETLGVIKSVDGSKINTKDKSRSNQRSQPYSVNPRKVKTVGSKKSIGAIGQTVHGLKENRQVCPLCKFEATTKNPYRHLQDHLARTHFKERLARELPASKPFNCPIAECDSQNLSDWQAVMRHYIGNKHGVLEKYVREELDCLRV